MIRLLTSRKNQLEDTRLSISCSVEADMKLVKQDCISFRLGVLIITLHMLKDDIKQYYALWP